MKKDIAIYIKTKKWGEVYASLSPFEKRMCISIASNRKTLVSSAARHSLIPRGTADMLLAHLKEVKLVVQSGESKSGKLYKIVDTDFETYCNEADRALAWAEAREEIEEEFYNLAAQRFEALEHLGLIKGNGHHIAKNIAATVGSAVKKLWRRK